MLVKTILIYQWRVFEFIVKKAIKELVYRVKKSDIPMQQKIKEIKRVKSAEFKRNVVQDAKRYYDFFGTFEGYEI